MGTSGPTARRVTLLHLLADARPDPFTKIPRLRFAKSIPLSKANEAEEATQSHLTNVGHEAGGNVANKNPPDCITPEM